MVSKQKQRRGKRSHGHIAAALGERGHASHIAQPKATAAPVETLTAFDRTQHLIPLLLAGIVSAVLILWAYWPTWKWMEEQWRTEPDYSHGYLVLPLAALLIYARRDSFPGFRDRLSWGGVWLILASVAMRVAGRFMFMDFLDAYSMLPLVAGIVWLLAGPAVARWAAPAILFLFLLSPLPFQMESVLSWKLQGIATAASTVILRILGLPAVAEGNTIWLGQTQMFVEEACSGMRIFVGMGAFALFWAALTQRSWVDRIVILASALPLAILANIIRVTLTGMAFYWLDSSTAKTLHDWLGFVMIALAAGMLWGVKAFWERLYYPEEVLAPRTVLQGA